MFKINTFGTLIFTKNHDNFCKLSKCVTNIYNRNNKRILFKKK